MIACESGTSDAPNTPCNNRNSTISATDVAMPHSADAATKPAMLIRR